jgi:hypothetical protein
MHLLTAQIRIFSALFSGPDTMNGPARFRGTLIPVPGPRACDEYDEAPEGPLMPPTLLPEGLARS